MSRCNDYGQWLLCLKGQGPDAARRRCGRAWGQARPERPAAPRGAAVPPRAAPTAVSAAARLRRPAVRVARMPRAAAAARR